MKKIFAIAIAASIIFGVQQSISRDENVFAKRQEITENSGASGAEAGGSVSDAMKKTAGFLNDYIGIDGQIIYVKIDSITKENDSLKTVIKNKAVLNERLSGDVKKKHDTIFYGMVGIIIIFLFLIMFMIFYFAASAGRKKMKKQYGSIEKLRNENRNVTELARMEVIALRTNAEKEIAVLKDNIFNERKSLYEKNDLLKAEKRELEKKINDKNDECFRLLLKLKSTNEKYEKALKADDEKNNDKSQEKLIEGLNIKIDLLTKERDEINNTISVYNENLEKIKSEKKSLEEKIALKENELLCIVQSNAAELGRLREENYFLREELNNINIEMKKEAKLRATMEKEIRRFINEIKRK